MTTINKTRTLRRFLLTWGFKSLWIQCFSWSACNPKATNPKDSNNQTKILHRETEQTNKNRSLPNCLIKCLATCSDTLPWRVMYSARSPPLQYSNTRKILSPVYKDLTKNHPKFTPLLTKHKKRMNQNQTSMASWSLMMLGWSMVLRIEISLRRLSLTLGLSFFLSISLIATSKPDDRCFASHTTAKEPDPSLRPSS